LSRVIDWLDAHSAAVSALATLFLVALTGYYAWFTRGLVRETRNSLLASARSTLQSRMDRVQEIMIRHPGLFALLDEPECTGAEQDARFHIANMFLAILEEAHTQYTMDRTMAEDDWRAWVATADVILCRNYISRFWQRVQNTYEPSFQRFVNTRLQDASQRSP